MTATLPAGPEFTLNGVRHQYTPVQDTKYSTLQNPRCSCGWHDCGYVRDWLALHYWEQHHRAALGRAVLPSKEGGHPMRARVDWSDYRDWQAGKMTPREAIDASPHRDAFLGMVEKFAAKANGHERVSVMWWHAPYIYVTVTDDRKEYPVSARACASFDLTNGKWASDYSKRRYAYARRGWQSFLENVVGCHFVAAYSDVPNSVTLAEMRAEKAAASPAPIVPGLPQSAPAPLGRVRLRAQDHATKAATS